MLTLLWAGGVILVVSGLVVLAAASHGLDERMPTQVLPRRFAIYPLVAGAILMILAGIMRLFP